MNIFFLMATEISHLTGRQTKCNLIFSSTVEPLRFATNSLWATSFPKYQKFLNHCIWNFLKVIMTASRKQPRALLELRVWNFLLFLTSSKRPLDMGRKGLVTISHSTVVQETEISQWKVQDFSSKLTFLMNKTFKTWGKSLHMLMR